MLIYIAGKYSGKDWQEIDDNIKAARVAAIRLMEAGHAVHNPMANTAHFEVDCKLDYEDYLKADFTILARCDAIYMLNNYRVSKGALRELAYAQSLKKIIFYEEETETPPLHPTELISPIQVKAFAEELGRMMSIHLSKNQDYSPANIFGPGEPGLYTRIWDKCTRLMNLGGFRIYLKSNDQPKTFIEKLWKIAFGRAVVIDNIVYEAPRIPKNESIEDNLDDLSVYGVITKLFRTGKWGK